MPEVTRGGIQAPAGTASHTGTHAETPSSPRLRVRRIKLGTVLSENQGPTPGGWACTQLRWSRRKHTRPQRDMLLEAPTCSGSDRQRRPLTAILQLFCRNTSAGCKQPPPPDTYPQVYCWRHKRVKLELSHYINLCLSAAK